MDVREFEYLVAIADNKSVTKAANQIFVTQSALSKFVQKKEEELGTLLFQRVGKTFVLTEAGEKCVEAARKILAIHQQMTNDVTQIAHGGKVRLRLGLHTSWSAFFFLYIYPAFREQCPETELILCENGASETLRSLYEGELDMAVTTITGKNDPRFVIHPLSHQQLVLAVARDNPITRLAKTEPGYPYPVLEWDMLQNLPLVMRRYDQKTYEYAMAHLHAHHVTPRVVLEAANRETALRGVESGMGAMYVIDDPVHFITHPNITYLSFRDSVMTEEVNLALLHNYNAPLGDTGKALWDLIIHEYARIVEKYQ